MKIGIIAEFNPLHNGHIHLIDTVKSQFPDASLYIIISTYFTQRGEPSFIDPYTKVKQTLENGADFVFELPPFFSTQRADIFARGAISICSNLQLDAIAFGVENLDTFSITTVPEQNKLSVRRFSKRIDTFNQEKEAQCSWKPQANNILGHFYTVAAQELYPTLRLVPILREGAGFNDPTLATKFASATAIRKAVMQKQFQKIERFIPYAPSQLHNTVTWDALFPSFLHMLNISQNSLEIATLGKSGLFQRLQKAKNCSDFEEYITNVKTRAYTRTSIQRAMLFLLLNITQEELDTCTSKAYQVPPRLIGFKQEKSAELKQIRHILHIQKEYDPLYYETYSKFKNIYQLHLKPQPHQHFPFIFDSIMA